MKLLQSSRATLAFLTVALLAACGQSGNAADRPLYFTAIPDDNTTELAAKFGPLAEHLSKELGVPVEYVPTTSYSASVESFKNGDVELAWFGGLTGVQARAAVPGAKAIAQGKVDPNYKSYFIAHKDTGVEKSESFPEVMRGRTFTFGSDLSTSGRLMPEHFIRQNTGQEPSEFFGMPNNYSGSHDKTAKLVEAGTFEFGALSYKAYDGMVAEGKLDPDLCRIIWETPPYADYNWTVAASVEERFGAGFTEKIRAALIGITDENLLEAMRRPEGLITAQDDDFASILELATRLDFVR